MTNDPHAGLLDDLRAFVADEQTAGRERIRQIWHKPIEDKLEKGQSQGFTRLERADNDCLWATLDETESRFREGDLLCLHLGSPFTTAMAYQCTLELEEDERWLLRVRNGASTALDAVSAVGPDGRFYADPDMLDLTPFYTQALEDIAASTAGRDTILPLLAGALPITFDAGDDAFGERTATAEGLNRAQARAVGMALGANQVACIQGPPGTGKTRVLSLIVKLMVERGDRVLVTSHTHMAIHNALNKVHAQGVPTVKIGRETQRKGLSSQIPIHPSFTAWTERPYDGGYAIGATAFATCTQRLAGCGFETVVFDEASQVTLPLALMAMRVAKRFIFIGDDKQLPPVVLSRSILSDEPTSIFAKLTSRQGDHTVMLTETYRMNRWLAAWPSQTFYDGKLASVGDNRERRFRSVAAPAHLRPVFDPAASAVFIPTTDQNALTRSPREAALVADICAAATEGGLPLADIGVVTPFRAQGRLVRNLLARRFGLAAARNVIADTVERMQGQERELVILSLATGSQLFLASIAEFFFQPERLNVAITRCMTKLIVIGPDTGALPDCEQPVLRQWVRWYADMIAHCQRVELQRGDVHP
jgi:DNA replication ATP-dependent helicase Dna2